MEDETSKNLHVCHLPLITNTVNEQKLWVLKDSNFHIVGI